MSSLTSPDNETFSTPPSSPAVFIQRDHELEPALSRRTSRPSNLKIGHTSADWNQDVVLEEQSPELSKHETRTPVQLRPEVRFSEPTQPEGLIGTSAPAPTPRSVAQSHLQQKVQNYPPMKSPCFVHSHLDKGAALSDWLRNRQGGSHPIGVSKAIGEAPLEPDSRTQTENGSAYANGIDGSVSSSPSMYGDDEDENESHSSSLTRQLAETAAGVREMSKQLGRARVRSNIQSILIITKARDNRLIKLTRDLALYLMKKPRPGARGLIVYVDKQLRTSKRFDAAGIERDHPELFVPPPRRRTSSSNSLASLSSSTSKDKDEFNLKEEGQLRYWTSDMCSKSPHLFDFVITLGGDGTVLFTSWLFQRIVPPVLSFALGSLGFLTNFDFAENQAVMDSAIDAGIRVNLRMRFTCTVYRAVAPEDGKGRQAIKKAETGEILMKNIEKDGWEALEDGWSGTGAGAGDDRGMSKKDKEIMCFTTRPVESFEVLNDLVVDRGPSPYVSLLELFGDEHHMTTVQADGLTVSTPTGSTAYSLSAGGSLVHPEIPAILITPICPHTLSFRPMLLPDSMELRICVPFNSRSTAWASFDGRGRVELKQGDHIKVTASKYPFPTVCADKQSTDWFHAISRTLKWNERERQKSFVVVEEGPAGSSKRGKAKADGANRTAQVANGQAVLSKEPPESVTEEEESDEEEDKFDIDDSSPEANAAAEAEAQAKAAENAKALKDVGRRTPQPTPREAAEALVQGNPFVSSRPSHPYSGVDTPDRFAGPHPHPPHRHIHRHVEPSSPSSSISSPLSSSEVDVARARDGARDDIHAPWAALSSGKSRIPRDRDVETDSMNMKTPTVGPALMHGHGHGHIASRANHHRSSSRDIEGGHRAFAVWGHDESDSNTSDSDGI